MSPRRQSPICSPMDPDVQVLDLAIEVCLVVLPCQPIHTRCGISLEGENTTRSSSTLIWWKSEVNRSFFRCLATCRMRSSACVTLSRSCARRVLCWLAFPSASALGSTDSAASCPALFVGFPATIAESDFPRLFIIGYGSSPSRCGPGRRTAAGQTWDLPVPIQGASAHARFFDHAGPFGPCDGASETCCLPRSKQRRRPGIGFRGSMAGLCPPLPTLRRRPYGRQRTARGRCGSLLLHRSGLAPPTPCRSPGALRVLHAQPRSRVSVNPGRFRLPFTRAKKEGRSARTIQT